MYRQGETSQAANDMTPPECQTPINQWEKARPRTVHERGREVETEAEKGETKTRAVKHDVQHDQ